MHRTMLSVGLLVGALLPLQGCMVHLIAPYDPTLDATMTQVQQDTELFFGQLGAAAGTDAAGYAQNKAFYVREEATVRTLLTRAQAVPKSQEVAIQIAAIESTLVRTQAMHERDGTLNGENVQLTLGALESEFRSFFGLELALRTKPGLPPSGALAPGVTQ